MTMDGMMNDIEQHLRQALTAIEDHRPQDAHRLVARALNATRAQEYVATRQGWMHRICRAVRSLREVLS